ncbi:histidine kinase N-terminal 7TM domain-containing protein [Methanocella arvoryzae]|nr:histidine kinase N-terminal 7TM domain-containing protein [Methanocella arvoryzae]
MILDFRTGLDILVLCLSTSQIGYATIVIVAIILVMHIWQRRSMPGGRYFSLLLTALSFWALMCLIELSATDQFLLNTVIRLQYVAVTCAGPLWLLFVLDYGYRSHWILKSKIHWIWVIPVIASILALTNEWHGLIWPRAAGDLSILGHGLFLSINLAYTYLLLLAGFCLMLLTTMSSYKSDLRKALTLMAATMIPIASSLIIFLGLEPAGIDITPPALTATIMIFAWSIYHQQLFPLVPVAKELLVRSMPDGMLVLDKDGRLVDQNPAAESLLGITGDSLGQSAEKVLSRWPGLIDCINLGTTTEIVVSEADAQTWLDVRVSTIDDGPGKFYGRLVALRDITQHKLSEEAITRSNESLRVEIAERKQVEKALQAEIEVRRQAEEKLEISLKEKELLLKEIHHRVKNNLQIISSLMNLQISTMTNEAARASLKESQNRIKSMALIHEQLYLSRDLASIDFKGYVANLISFWARSYVIRPEVTFVARIDDISLDIDTAIPCGLIINELISNSLKYAFVGGQPGTIEVAMTWAGGGYRLSVSDDGIGLPSGLDFRNTTTLGMQLVVTLTEQLGGLIEHPDGPGTTFIITFSKGLDKAAHG